MRGFEPQPPVRSGLDAVRQESAAAPQLDGVLRIVDIVLTVIALPFFVTSWIGMAVFVKKWGKPDVMDWVFGAVAGLVVVPVILYLLGFGWVGIGWVVGIGFGAWCARGILRWVGKVRELGRFT